VTQGPARRQSGVRVVGDGELVGQGRPIDADEVSDRPTAAVAVSDAEEHDPGGGADDAIDARMMVPARRAVVFADRHQTPGLVTQSDGCFPASGRV
jgi:hypothetical protein